MFFHEVFGENGNIVFAVPKGGNLNHKCIEPIKQVLAKSVFFHLVLDTLVGGKDKPDIHNHLFRIAKPSEGRLRTEKL